MSQEPDPQRTHAVAGADDDLGFALPPPVRASRWVVAGIAVVLAGGAFAYGYARRKAAHDNIPAPQGSAEALRVEVVKPVSIASDRALDLPGTVRALEEVRLYPRVSGYVRAWHADIGDVVPAGKVLAEIDAPDAVAQLVQARAQLAQARAVRNQAIAQRDFSKGNVARYETMDAQQLVSRAQVDQVRAQARTDEATVAAAESSIAAQEAAVRRLGELVEFTKITAPFTGTVTARSIDRGALVSEANRTPLFTIAATDPVRVFVDVPQTIAPSVRPKTAAKISVREFPDRTFDGEVARTTGTLDPDLHTLSVEVRVPNGDGALLPGMYVQVRLTLPVPHRVLELPITALYSDAAGLRVAVVDAASRVKLVPITIERDTGAAIHVATGLTGEERVVKLANPSIVDGALVEVLAAGSGSAKK
ncbi:MAG: efflux RND transporter periplasmic adaptor subunit [Deltaproteobacteria bacterium]|nr:efflux RND transporter periplasmic adaptor subunit [Deltaproteobacteria bacterium]MCW5808400.1 efflux RND transporter periplasmic adaptor subunit [Deltaproteobacteria bacterium]